MIRTQIQLDETTHTLAKQRAYAENKSLAAVVREALTQYLAPTSRSTQDRRIQLHRIREVQARRPEPPIGAP